MKTCRICNETKSLNLFPRHKRSCKKCEATRAREYYSKNADKVKELNKVTKFRLNYGITVAIYEQLLADQNGQCAICKSAEPKGRGAFHVDHDHVTGKIRGLLCHHCNLGLGNFKDSIETLIKAREYLNASR